LKRVAKDIDPAAMMRARRNTNGGIKNRILSKKELRMEALVIKGPKLVCLTPQYKHDFTGLLELCDALQFNSTLTSLDISDNLIRPEGMRKLLAPSLRSTTRLVHLDLTRNDLRPLGMIALASAMHELSGLRSLVLADNNIGDPGATALASPLAACTQLLKLDLQSNGISAAGLQVRTHEPELLA
jgi:Leucine-rich repeat (LRR) protein